MCRDERFIPDISAEHLEGEEGFVDTFYQLKEDLDVPDIFIDFEYWAVDPIIEQLKRLVDSPGSNPKAPTALQDYYTAETFVFTLANQNVVPKGSSRSTIQSLTASRGPKSRLPTRTPATVLPSPVNIQGNAIP